MTLFIPKTKAGRAGVWPALCAALVVSACAPKVKAPARPPTPDEIAQLWVAPPANRDLFRGPGDHDPPAQTEKFKVVTFDASGNSVGYEIIDASGREWKAKLGVEVQPEIVASRLLWAIGFHQPPMSYVGNLQLEGGRPEDSGQPARFRAEFGYKSDGDWSWHDNPFVGTRQLNGLLVANLILNNWDLKATQNRIYISKGSGDGVARQYVVQDLGAALGRTGWPVGNRNDIDGFERQNLIKRVNHGVVEFDYEARHTELFKGIAPGDVVWVCQLFARLTDAQWNDAFRAANYTPELTQRFIAKLKAKVQEGLALDASAARR